MSTASKKTKAVSLTYRKGAPKKRYFDAIRGADETDLRILCTIELLHDEGKELETEVCRRLSIDPSVYRASVKYWSGAGMLTLAADATEKASLPSAHAGGKLESATELPSYSTEELTALIQKRQITSEFVDDAQRIFGKMFNAHEISILIGLVDYMGFDEEAVLILLAHMVKVGKRSMHSTEKMAWTLLDQEITSAADLEQHLHRIERNHENHRQITKLFEDRGRELTLKDKNALKKCAFVYDFDMDVLRIAFDVTVKQANDPSPVYMKTILEAWHNEGLSTAKEVQALLDKEKGAVQSNQNSSFDTDEFFQAALDRAFDLYLK